MTTLLETLTSYLPRWTVQRHALDPAPLSGPIMERLPAAVLFADVSGFTALSERLAQRGPAGAEELIRILNGYFGHLIELVSAHGGDVVKFAGDALLALWPAGDEPLEQQVQRAAQCALAMQEARPDRGTDTTLSLRVGVGAGEMVLAQVGGVQGRWELLVTGEPLVDMGPVMHQVRPDEVGLTAAAWELLKDRAIAAPLPETGMRLKGLREPLSLQPLERLLVDPMHEEALHGYLPGAILSRLKARQVAWLAELRQVSVLFVNLPDLNHQTDLARAQDIVETLQTVLDRYEGSLNKLSVDEKGVTLVAAMGLPPYSHEDDALRAVQAALAIRRSFEAQGLRSAIGITTGRAFCGEVGNARRREYTLIGDVVNLAARLMQASQGDVFCDEATYLEVEDRVVCEALPPVSLKGKAEPVRPYRPRHEAKRTTVLASMVGRVAERERLARALGRLTAAGQGGLVLIEAEAGLGKSRLVADFAQRVQAEGVRLLFGAADAIERSTPYFAWQGVFAQVLGLSSLEDPAARRAQVQQRLGDDPVVAPYLSLLGALLNADLPQEELVAQMTGQARAETLRQLALHLLRAELPGPVVLVIEDAHWLDSASWAMLFAIYRELPGCLLVVAMRPPSEPVSPEYRQLVVEPGIERLSLQAMAPDEIEALIGQRLGVPSLPGAVSELIRERAEGHPYFSEELAYALRDSGYLIVEGGSCRLAPGAGDLASLDLPGNVQGVITSRVDRLEPSLQLTLKVASVIGRAFAFRVLKDVHPIEADRDRVREFLESLAQLDLTPKETPEPDLTYIFKHAITHEVVYNLMLFAQRAQLHRAVAEWLERVHAHELPMYYPLLAHHWSRAEDRAKALEYLDKAGQQAYRSGAYTEAITFLTEAIAHEQAAPTPEPVLVRAQRHLLLGESYHGIGKSRESYAALIRALELLGHSPAKGTVRVGLGLVGLMARQLWDRLLDVPCTVCQTENREALLLGSRAYERLGQLHFFENRPMMTLYCSLQSATLAEQVGPSPELMRAWANMAISVGLIPFHGLAEKYVGLAARMVADGDHLAAGGWVSELSGLYRLGRADFERSQELLERAATWYERVGDFRHQDESTGILGGVFMHRGDYARSYDHAHAVLQSAIRRGDQQCLVMGTVGRAQLLLKEGKPDEAISLLRQAFEVNADQLVRSDVIWTNALMAMALLQTGSPQEAERHLEKALRAMEGTMPTAAYALEGYSAVVEASLMLWQANPDSKRLRLRAMRACFIFKNYARVFQLAQPRSMIWRASCEWLSGHRGRSILRWRSALVQAERLGLPFDQGLAHLELGRHLRPGHAKREGHLRRAAELLNQLGARHYAEQAEAILALGYMPK
ncbi:MAG TPA: adenylate/guanylate cyclase domain-containing protein [Stenomitos sp.]